MGIGCGILTAVIRNYGGYPEGVSYAILLMNVATPLIDKLTMPKIFGEVRMSDTIKMGLKLLLITAVATFALALTQMITEEPIRVQAERANNEAMAVVLHGADEFVPLEVDEGTYPNILGAHEGLVNGEAYGYVFKTFNSGYGGPIEIIVGLDSEGTISGVRVLQHTETPSGCKSTRTCFS